MEGPEEGAGDEQRRTVGKIRRSGNAHEGHSIREAEPPQIGTGKTEVRRSGCIHGGTPAVCISSLAELRKGRAVSGFHLGAPARTWLNTDENRAHPLLERWPTEISSQTPTVWRSGGVRVRNGKRDQKFGQMRSLCPKFIMHFVHNEQLCRVS